MGGAVRESGKFFLRDPIADISPSGDDDGGHESGIPLVKLKDGEGFLLRPVMNQLCRYESIIDGTLDLVDIAILNEALDAQEENQRRLREHQDRMR